MDNLAQAEEYVSSFPYWYTGPSSPGMSREQVAYARRARAFIAKHPLETLQIAQKQLRHGPMNAEKIFQCLAYHGSREFEPLFVDALHKGNASWQIVDYLGRVKSKDAVLPLCGLVQKGLASSQIVAALEKIGDQRALPALLSIASGADSQLAAQAIHTIGVFGVSEAVEPLCAILLDGKRNDSMRAAAAEVLARIGDRRAIPALKKACFGREGWKMSSIFFSLLNLDRERAVSYLQATENPFFARYMDRETAVAWLRELLQKKPLDCYITRELVCLGDSSIATQLKKHIIFDSGEQWMLDALFELHDPEAEDIALWEFISLPVTENPVRPESFPESLARNATAASLPLIRVRVDKKIEWDVEFFAALCRLGDTSDLERVRDFCNRANSSHEMDSGGGVPAGIAAALSYFARVSPSDAARVARLALKKDLSIPLALEILRDEINLDDIALLLAHFTDHPCKENADAYAMLASVQPNLREKIRISLKGFVETETEWNNYPSRGIWAAYALARIDDLSGARALALKIEDSIRSRAENAEDEERSNWFDSYNFPIALKALEALGATEAVPVLLSALRECTDDYSRIPVACTVCKLGECKEAFAICAGVLREETPKSQLLAAIDGVSAQRQGVNCAHMLERLAMSDDVEIAKAALQALVKTGDERTLLFLQTFPYSRRGLPLEQFVIAREQLRRRFSQQDAGQAMGERLYFEKTGIPRPATVQRWLDVTLESWRNKKLNFWTLQSLCAAREKRVIPLLREMLKNPVAPCMIGEAWNNPEFYPVFIAAKDLGDFAGDGIEALCEEGLSGTWYAREVCAEALSKTDDPSATQSLIAMLGFRTSRYYAIEGLVKRKERACVPALEKLLAEDDVLTPYWVIDGLSRLGGREAVDALIRVLESKNPGRSREAANALGKLNEKRAIPKLLAAIERCSWLELGMMPEYTIALTKLTGESGRFWSGGDWAAWYEKKNK